MNHSDAPGKYADFEGLRTQATALRRAGLSLRQIQEELGCSKSSVSLWVRDLPQPEPKCTPEERRARMNAGPARLQAARDEERVATKEAAAAAIGDLTDRELFIAGVTLYRAEGAKGKPHRRTEVLQFINSDPNVIRLFLRRLDLLEVARERLTIRVSIHETADVQAAVQFWAEAIGVDASRSTSDRARTCTVAWRAPGTA